MRNLFASVCLVGLGLSLIPNAVRADACTPEQRDEIIASLRETAESGNSELALTCGLTLPAGMTITKKIVIQGAEASNFTLDCNSATLNGGPNTRHHNKDMIEVRSRKSGSGSSATWSAPHDVTIRRCDVLGSIRIWGMGRNGEAPDVRESSRRDSGHVSRLRRNAPRRITLDRMKLTGQGVRTPLYISPGVTYTTVTNSEVTGRAESVGVYLDTGSYGNVLRNNTLHVTSRKEYAWGLHTRKREEMAIDNSSGNTIVNNYFSTLEGGGIYIYRNCGEGGTVRHSTPSYNKIINNVFYYRNYKALNPAIYLGSRTDSWWRVYCDDDEGFPWGSSVSDRSFARYNVVMQNQFYPRRIYQGATLRQATLNDMIRWGDSSNRPNYVDHNEIVSGSTHIRRAAGCYVSSGYHSNFIQHGQSVDLYKNGRGGPACGYRLTCNDGTISYGSPPVSSCSLRDVPFSCQVTGNNNGCQRWVACPYGMTAVSAVAACNLEYGTVSSGTLQSVAPNTIKVVRKSDDTSDGRCNVGRTELRSGERTIEGLGGRWVSVGCREHDKNGGDCHIRGTLTCYASDPNGR